MSCVNPVPGDAQAMATLVDMDDVCGLPSADLPLFQTILDVVPAGLLLSRARLLDALRVLASDDPPALPTYSSLGPTSDSPLGRALAQWRAAHMAAPADPSPSPSPIDIDLWDISNDVLSAPFPLPTPKTPPTSAPAPPSEDAIMAEPEPAAKAPLVVPPLAVPPLAAPSVIAASSAPVPLPVTPSSEVSRVSLPPVAPVPSPAPASIVGTPIPRLVPAPQPATPGVVTGTPDVVERVAVEALLAPSRAASPAPQRGMPPPSIPRASSRPRPRPIVVVPRRTPSQSASQATPSPVPAASDTSATIAALFDADAESEAGPALQSNEGESEVDQLSDSNDVPSPAEIVVPHISGPPAVGYGLRSAIHNLGLRLEAQVYWGSGLRLNRADGKDGASFFLLWPPLPSYLETHGGTTRGAPVITPLQVWQVDARYCCPRNSGNLSLLPPHTKDLRPRYCLAWFNLTRQGKEQVFEIRQGRCLACYKAASGGSTRSRSCWSQETINNILDTLPNELLLDPKRYYLNLAANDEGTEDAAAVERPVSAAASRSRTAATSSHAGTTKPIAKSKGKQPAAAPRTSSQPVRVAAVASRAAVASSMRDTDSGAEVEVEEDIEATIPQDMSWEYWAAGIANALCQNCEAHARVLVRATVRCWGWLKTQTMYVSVRAAVTSTVTAVSDISFFVECSGQQLNDYVESQAPVSTGWKRVRISTGSEASTSK
ncbi:hypothetical protein K488DRAFT_92428 [Vararia minispora EC-137]|uniref:Uncharacterized protein n=1 Tax=Vararia minispora EC-137 TaxID=1314806 RepID=A0ACB8Q4F3_9AGAM|nr:hypothetical protein K488DRAFT_92428 [Vararia minispora EC-137]